MGSLSFSSAGADARQIFDLVHFSPDLVAGDSVTLPLNLESWYRVAQKVNHYQIVK